MAGQTRAFGTATSSGLNKRLRAKRLPHGRASEPQRRASAPLLPLAPVTVTPWGGRTRPSGECEDDETWEYLAGDKGYKRCDHVAKKPDPRCGRVSDDGVVASEACPKTCGTCG